jgi:hypothetical protein
MKKIIFFSIAIFLAVTATSLPQTAFNSAIDFDGNGDYANTFNRPYFPTINGTIEAWVKVTSISLPGGNQGEAFVAKNEEQWNNGDFYAFFEYYNGRLKSRVQKPPSLEVDVISNNNFLQNLEQWFHYAFTWGAYGMKMYINGVLQSSQNSLTYSALNNDYNFYVGAHGYMLHNGQYVVADFFDGQMDELRIWNYQKNSQQINILMNAPLDSTYFVTIDSGLVGYWRFDVLEDLGINNDGPDDVRDLSVLNNHLDLAGDAHLVQPDPIIPVELVSFLAESINGHIQLKWSTSSEMNNRGFEIERCAEKSEWVRIGFIEGHGTTTEVQDYKYIDDLFSVNSEIVFYRLKQIDYNGQFKYSSEIEVNVPPAVFKLEQNYPNPFNPNTTIKYSIPKKNYVLLVIYDSLGQEVEKLVDEIKEAGSYQINFDGTKLSSGIYFYTLASDKFISTRKMILIK